MKKGITAATVTIMVVVMAILLGTITITSYNSIQNAKKIVFSLEISNIQEEVDSFSKNSENSYPILDTIYTINLVNTTENSIGQFDGETKNENGEITLYEIDLTALGIDNTEYGNKKTENDIYVLSKETGKVYYLEGIEFNNTTYYTLTQDLIDIKEENEKSDAVLPAKPLIASDGIVEKTLNGVKEKYIANIEVVGEDIEVIKYEIGFIDEEAAGSYFRNNGKTLYGDRIKLDKELPVTLYARDSKGQYTIKYAGYPYIPDTFVASRIETEDEVNEGLVIYDIKESEVDNVSWTATSQRNTTYLDVQELYNQFVWIPVPDMREFVRRDGYDNGVLQSLIVEGGTTSEPYNKKYGSTILSFQNDLTGEYAEHKAMTESVDKFGGFYIGRYEASTLNTRTDYASGTSVDENGNPIVFVQKNRPLYCYVGWGDTMIDVKSEIVNGNITSGLGAVVLSRGLYNDNSLDIVSTLIYGVQWDAAINFVKDIDNPNVEGKKYIEDSTGMGRYNGGGYFAGLSGINLGENNLNMVKNIYDMAGSLREWTMEASGIYPRMLRGGGMDTVATNAPASNRLGASPYNSSGIYGFRVALYIKD